MAEQQLPDISVQINELPFDRETKRKLFDAFYEDSPRVALESLKQVPLSVRQAMFDVRGKIYRGEQYDIDDIVRAVQPEKAVSQKTTAPPPVVPGTEKLGGLPSVKPQKAKIEEVSAPGLAKDIVKGAARGVMQTALNVPRAISRIPLTGGTSFREQIQAAQPYGDERAGIEERLFVGPEKRKAQEEKRRQKTTSLIGKTEERMTPAKPLSAAGEFAEALGSTAPYAVASVLAGPAGAVTLGALSGAEEAAGRADVSRIPLSEGQRLAVAAAGGLLGSTEALPFGRLLNRLKSAGVVAKGVNETDVIKGLFPKIKEYGTSAVKQFVREGGQEALAGAGQDVIEATYEGRPAERIGESFWEDFKMGGGVGSFIDILTTMAGSRAGRARLRKSGIDPAALRDWEKSGGKEAEVAEASKPIEEAPAPPPVVEARPAVTEKPSVTEAPPPPVVEPQEPSINISTARISKNTFMTPSEFEVTDITKKPPRELRFEFDPESDGIFKVKDGDTFLAILNPSDGTFDIFDKEGVGVESQIKAKGPKDAFVYYLEKNALESKEKTSASESEKQSDSLEESERITKEYEDFVRKIAEENQRKLEEKKAAAETPVPEVRIEAPVTATGVTGAPPAPVVTAPPPTKATQPAVKPEKTAKPLWEMSLDELGKLDKNLVKEEENSLISAFGKEGAKKYKRLQKESGSMDKAKADKAAKEIESMESALTDEQRDRIYGVELDYYPEEVKEYVKSLNNLDFSSEEALAFDLKWAFSNVGEKKSPDLMTSKEQRAWATIRYAMEKAKGEGLDLEKVVKSSLEGAASRFTDPEDAAFMLRRFMKKTPKEGEAPKSSKKTVATKALPAASVASPPQTKPIPTVKLEKPAMATETPPPAAAETPSPKPSQPPIPQVEPKQVEKKSPPPDRRSMIQRGKNDPVTVFFKDSTDKALFDYASKLSSAIRGKKEYSSDVIKSLESYKNYFSKKLSIQPQEAQSLIASYREMVIDRAKGMPKADPGVLEIPSFIEFAKTEIDAAKAKKAESVKPLSKKKSEPSTPGQKEAEKVFMEKLKQTTPAPVETKPPSSNLEAVYQDLWKKVQAGETKEKGYDSEVLKIAKEIRDRGGLKDYGDFRKFQEDYRDLAKVRTSERSKKRWELADKYSVEKKAEPARPPAEKKTAPPPTVKPSVKEQPKTTEPTPKKEQSVSSKKVSVNDIEEVGRSSEGEIELAYGKKRYQAVPMLSGRGYRIYDMESGDKVGEARDIADPAEALAGVLETEVATPVPSVETPKIQTKYIEPKTPQYRKGGYLMALKMKTDRNPVIWMNNKASTRISRLLTENGVLGVSKSAIMGRNYPYISQLQQGLDIILSEKHRKFKGSESDYEFLKEFQKQVEESAQASKTGSLSTVNVDSPQRKLRVLPSAYQAIKGLAKGKTEKDVGTVGDLIRTFRHEGVHSELTTVIANIPKAEMDTIINSSGMQKVTEALKKKGYSKAGDPYLAIDEFMAHYLSGDKEFFKDNDLTGEDLVRTYASIRKYILGIDEAAIGRAERFRKPGVKTSE